MTAQGRVRRSLSVLHLLGAAQFARAVHQLETENDGRPLGAFFEEIVASATGCVFLSVAALEAWANELFIDWEKYLDGTWKPAMEPLWELAEQRTVLEKFDLFLRLRERGKMNHGGAGVEHTKALVRLRNELTHFHAEWQDESERHARLSGALRGKFALSPFIGDGESEFPTRWASRGCTAWALRTVQAFASEFAMQAGVEDRFLQFKDRLQTQ